MDAPGNLAAHALAEDVVAAVRAELQSQLKDMSKQLSRLKGTNSLILQELKNLSGRERDLLREATYFGGRAGVVLSFVGEG